MSFNSLEFAIFFPVILVLLRLTCGWPRLCILLAGNFLFLQVLGFKHLVFMINVIAISYLAGVLIEKFRGDRQAKILFLVSSVGLAVSPLIYFKYFGFISCLSHLMAGTCNASMYVESYSSVLPLGISFYTLQGISYIVDVYYGKSASEKNLLYFANFKSFFPQLVAGPIERVHTLLPQLKKDFKGSERDLNVGLSIMAWGFFKKIVIADNLTAVVDPVFADPQNFKGYVMALAVLAFTIQIYCDFSGYTDIATGAARMLGIRLSANFNNPYFANSISNFWHRWHISLSTWFRDYVYKPIGGNRSGTGKMYLGLIAVFLISGLWHGANFTFIVWAGIHLSAVIGEKVMGIKRKDEPVAFGIKPLLNWGATFAVVMLGWVFFRAKSMDSAVFMIKSIVKAPFDFAAQNTLSDLSTTIKVNLTIGLAAATFMFAAEYLLSQERLRENISGLVVRRVGAALTYAIILVILTVGNFGRSSFIYFQF